MKILLPFCVKLLLVQFFERLIIFTRIYVKCFSQARRQSISEKIVCIFFLSKGQVQSKKPGFHMTGKSQIITCVISDDFAMFIIIIILHIQ